MGGGIFPEHTRTLISNGHHSSTKFGIRGERKRQSYDHGQRFKGRDRDAGFQCERGRTDIMVKDTAPGLMNGERNDRMCRSLLAISIYLSLYIV